MDIIAVCSARTASDSDVLYYAVYCNSYSDIAKNIIKTFEPLLVSSQEYEDNSDPYAEPHDVNSSSYYNYAKKSDFIRDYVTLREKVKRGQSITKYDIEKANHTDFWVGYSQYLSISLYEIDSLRDARDVVESYLDVMGVDYSTYSRQTSGATDINELMVILTTYMDQFNKKH